MVTIGKRMQYVSDNESLSSTENENSDDMDYPPYKKYTSNELNVKQEKYQHQSQQQRKRCLSKNAIMARENRLRKKLYINNLETENQQLKRDNRKFSKILNQQSNLIKNLKKEIKYLKSVLANSDDLLKLLKNINTRTGMSVTTSLGNKQNLSRSYVYKPKQPKTTTTTNQQTTWNCIVNEDDDDIAQNNDNPLLQSFRSPPSDDLDTTSIMNDFEFDNNLLDDYLKPLENNLIDNVKKEDQSLNEHNYTTKATVKNNNDDVGVCLHVSKHRVSLEFCSKCSDNATSCWNMEESS